MIFVDQRGSGRSLPYGSLENNTTEYLLDDLEYIREQFKIDTWSIVGGSWGSTLALCYAIAFADKVTNLVIRGIFLGTQPEVDWVNRGEFKIFFPELWEEFASRTPREFHDDPDAYHAPRIQGDNEEYMKESVYACSQVEYGLLTLDDRPKVTDYETFDPSGSRIMYHFINQGCFMSENYILKNAHKITAKVHIVQGRYDMICLPKYAYQLHQALTNSSLQWVIAGHSGGDRANFDTTKAIIATIN